METIRIAFADFWSKWKIEDFVSPILKKHYDVVYDKENPDVLFHSIFNNMSTTLRFKCKKVLVLAENWRPSWFGSHYSISFDPPSETNFRLPLWQMYWLLKPALKDRLFERKRVEGFERFCAFTVSNPSNMLRQIHFQIISQYKRVHAYGKVGMNDSGLKRASRGKYWREAKEKFFLKHPHKFMMAYENTSTQYYCTEKLMDAFLVGSLPIYWGDPKVVEDWNQKAFIIVQSQGAWFDHLKTADVDKTFWEDFYMEPVFTDDQKSRHLANLEEFEDWLVKIVK